jgi:hypothetical protein
MPESENESLFRDALPSDDKRTFVVEIMRRARELPFDSGPIADEDLTTGIRRLHRRPPAC